MALDALMDAHLDDIFWEVRTPIVTKSKPTDPQSAIFGGVFIPQTVRRKVLNINKICLFVGLKPYKTAQKALFGPFRHYSALTTPITSASE